MTESDGRELFGEICTEVQGGDVEAPEQGLRLAVGIAREGREGREAGTVQESA